MNNVLEGIEPKNVMKYFEKLTEIPRGSGNEQEVSDYLVEFAKTRDLEVTQDKALNVIIKKPATKGYEKGKSVILQGHMDIVCIKEANVEFDFEKDPIDIYVDGDMIRTKGTTLGADNGIAVAMGLAILDSNDIDHPDLTVLITTNEETGMEGVLALEKGSIKGDILMNLDSEEEGVLLASCAGGVRSNLSLPIAYIDNQYDYHYDIIIDGLLGGHSGAEIDKKRASAIKLMGRVLAALNEATQMAIHSVNGGEKMNAIAKRCKAKISINDNKIFESVMLTMEEKIKDELKTSDQYVLVGYEKIDSPKEMITHQNKDDLIGIMRLIPQGIQTMSADIEGLVESSSNVGVIETKENKIDLNSAVRSSVKSLKDELTDRIDQLAKITHSKQTLIASYPAWTFEKKSYTRDLMKKVYLEMYDKPLEVDAIHAGLECGFLKEKIGDIDMVSLGPNMYDVHTPNEHISISSVKKVYEFLVQVLKKMK